MPLTFPDIPERFRAYVYRTIGAVLFVLAAKGVIELDDVALYLAAAAVVLAVANTSTKADHA